MTEATKFSLKNKTIFITGASRGIGREIALRCAKEGANIVITGKTVEPHEKLAGTILSVAEEVKQAGGQSLPIQLDVRDEEQIHAAVEKTVATFGGIDILINNASAIFIANTLSTPMKRFDLIEGVNARGTFACSQACIPFLKKSANPHILNLSPPLSMHARWFKDHLAYTMSKYGMSMCTLGMSAEFKSDGIAVNSLWPKTIIATAAIEYNFPPEVYKRTRQPAIVAEAAYTILTQDSKTTTGNFFLDEDVLKTAGITDFRQYATHPDLPPLPDYYLE